MAIRIINKEDGTEVTFANRQQTLLNLYAPISDDFSLKSDTLAEIVEKYKDVPLTKFVPSVHQRRMMRLNPEYGEDLPKYIVEGYDQEVSSSDFEQRIRDEFWKRFQANDKRIFQMINSRNPTYRIIW